VFRDTIDRRSAEAQSDLVVHELDRIYSSSIALFMASAVWAAWELASL